MIMSMVLFLISFIFYVTFYMYNRCIIAQDAYILAYRGSLCGMEDAQEIQQYIINSENEKFGNKYICTDNIVNEVHVDNQRVRVKASGSMNTTHWIFEGEAQAERISPTDCIRNIRLLKKAGKLITEE